MKYMVLCVFVVALLASQASADMIDLSTGATGLSDSAGAIWSWIDPSGVGTGNFDPFVRIQSNDVEEGYNTSGTPWPDVKTGIWTHGILLNDIPIVTVGGVDYREILLDINESGGRQTLLSLDDLQIFQSSAGNLTTAVTDRDLSGVLTGLGDLVYRLPVDQVLLDYDLNPGSGWGDVQLWLPKTLFTGSGTWFTLYSHFGDPETSSDGFEEWAVRGTTPPDYYVPLPGAVLLGFLGLGAAGLKLRRFA